MILIVVSEYRLIYLSVPRTGSTAMEFLLVNQYKGVRIANKHSGCRELQQWLGENHQNASDWKVLMGIRNPFDSLVSKWLKIKSNHKGKRLRNWPGKYNLEPFHLKFGCSIRPTRLILPRNSSKRTCHVPRKLFGSNAFKTIGRHSAKGIRSPMQKFHRSTRPESMRTSATFERSTQES